MNIYINTDTMKHWQFWFLCVTALFYLSCAIWMFINEQAVSWYVCFAIFGVEGGKLVELLFRALTEKDEEEVTQNNNPTQNQGSALQ